MLKSCTGIYTGDENEAEQKEKSTDSTSDERFPARMWSKRIKNSTQGHFEHTKLQSIGQALF